MNSPWLDHLLGALHLRATAEAVKEKSVPHHRASVWYYMGGLALMFFTIQVMTGIMLLFYYEPSAELANKSIERIMTEVPCALPWLGDIISSLLKGAKDVNGTTLTRMFALHVGVLPAFAILLVVIHATLTLLLGSGVPPGAKVTGSTKYFPDYLLKET